MRQTFNLLRKALICIFCLVSFEALATTPQEFVNDTASKVMAIIKSSQSDLQKKSELTDLFIQTMDIEWIAKFVLGRNWIALSDAEKDSYMKAYRGYLISSYVPLFKKYNGQDVVINAVKPLEANNYQVLSQIVAQDKVIAVEYRLVNVNNSFKVRDISAEGISLLQTQRSDFATVIANGGINALIDRLNAKANDDQ